MRHHIPPFQQRDVSSTIHMVCTVLEPFSRLANSSNPSCRACVSGRLESSGQAVISGGGATATSSAAMPKDSNLLTVCERVFALHRCLEVDKSIAYVANNASMVI